AEIVPHLAVHLLLVKARPSPKRQSAELVRPGRSCFPPRSRHQFLSRRTSLTRGEVEDSLRRLAQPPALTRGLSLRLYGRDWRLCYDLLGFDYLDNLRLA